MIKTILIIASVIASFFLGRCIGIKDGELKTSEQAKELIEKILFREKYVLIDGKGILHTKRSCIHLMQENVGVEYKETKLLNRNDLNKVCPFCIGEDDYESIITTLDSTKNKIVDVSTLFSQSAS